jgi:hypothetical protein
MFTKPWKVSYGSITLVAMLAYDLQRYHSKFCVDIVDQVLENIRLGMEQNIYKNNQKRVATVKYLGELYIYRLVNSRVIFDTLWSLVTFGHSMWLSRQRLLFTDFPKMREDRYLGRSPHLMLPMTSSAFVSSAPS